MSIVRMDRCRLGTALLLHKAPLPALRFATVNLAGLTLFWHRLLKGLTASAALRSLLLAQPLGSLCLQNSGAERLYALCCMHALEWQLGEEAEHL